MTYWCPLTNIRVHLTSFSYLSLSSSKQHAWIGQVVSFASRIQHPFHLRRTYSYIRENIGLSQSGTSWCKGIIPQTESCKIIPREATREGGERANHQGARRNSDVPEGRESPAGMRRVSPVWPPPRCWTWSRPGWPPLPACWRAPWTLGRTPPPAWGNRATQLVINYFNITSEI